MSFRMMVRRCIAGTRDVVAPDSSQMVLAMTIRVTMNVRMVRAPLAPGCE